MAKDAANMNSTIQAIHQLIHDEFEKYGIITQINSLTSSIQDMYISIADDKIFIYKYLDIVYTPKDICEIYRDDLNDPDSIDNLISFILNRYYHD